MLNKCGLYSKDRNKPLKGVKLGSDVVRIIIFKVRHIISPNGGTFENEQALFWDNRHKLGKSGKMGTLFKCG